VASGGRLITQFMHIPSLIARKRDGGCLTNDEIAFLVAGLTDGSIPEYQWGALAMAIYFRTMDAAETWSLTRAMRDSGEVLDWGDAGSRPPVVDKHSTGGIGDKTSLILAPLLACDGLWVPMISGRGLGITGGTLDKLESIPGFRVGLTAEEMRAQIEKSGCFIAGQTESLCPADRKLYALRDVTATVPSISLITASIMSKKLAEGLDRLVLDVKWGRGAFMQTSDDAVALARALTDAGRAGGVPVRALLSPMNEPLGCAAGNALEVREAIEALHGRGPPDLVALTLDLACAVSETAREVHRRRMVDGAAWRKFQEMVSAQGGDGENLSGDRLPSAPVILDVPCPASGTLTTVDAAAVGQAVLELGAGRARATDTVDPAVGVDRLLKTGAGVRTGDPLCRIHARTRAAAESASTTVLAGSTVQ
jgi:pyrimidine-nucleoside phosphorylase